jgi:hypothetical protein
LAAISTGQRWSGRRKITKVHIRSLASPLSRSNIRNATALRRVVGVREDMTSFADREKEFEARFKHDQELRFKATARRNRLLGMWAAQKMGLTGADAETYVKEVVAAQFEPGGDKRVLDKIVSDLAAKGQTITPAQVRFELEHFAEQAKQQLMKE